MVLDARPDDPGSALEEGRSNLEAEITDLYLTYSPRVLRYLRHYAPGAAEDLSSEVWLAVARQLGEFRGDKDDFRAWLFTIARRRLIDHYRHTSRQACLVPLDGTPDLAGVVDVADIAAAALSAQEAVEALVRALSPRQAEVILLRVVADLSVEQVAAILGRSPSSVRVVQHRALGRLRNLWDSAVTR